MDDRSQIENLLALYAQRLDNAEFENLGELFAKGSVSITGGPQDGLSARGSADSEALYRRIIQLAPETGTTGTRHMITNIRIEMDGVNARSHCYFAVLQQTATLTLQIVASGYYEDRFSRDEQGDWFYLARDRKSVV